VGAQVRLSAEHTSDHRVSEPGYALCIDENGTMSAQLDVLTAGYAELPKVASTVVLIRDGDAVIVVDPGMVADRSRILDPLAALGVDPASVTDVIFSHHHPDHTVNAALFLQARVHDFWAIYERDEWTMRPADGFELAPSVTFMTTPGHTAQDITTLAATGQGLVACTHLWWTAEGPEVDPLGEDQAQLEQSRARLLERGPALIVPGHGEPFTPA
jgi:glyoxylase-like metal-dependent hydrolase (beta-lactamase superfamily II)